MTRSCTAVLAVAIAALVGTDSALAADSVVLLREEADPQAEAKRAGESNARVYRHAGVFVASLSASQRVALRSDPDVVSVSADRTMHRKGEPRAVASALPTLPFPGAQIVPTGVRRIDGLRSATAGIDGQDRRVDVDVAVVEGGISRTHSDLNVAGGANCAPDGKFNEHWHATHIAGSIAALDNGRGVVGVAPGARVWDVDIYTKQETTTLEALICGFDWVIGQARTIEVAEMSSSFVGFDDPNCGVDPPDPVHAALCRSVEAGTTWVFSAGNEFDDTADWVPAAFEQGIAVSALADYDGRPGGLSEQTCLRGIFDLGADDTFAVYSNFGADVDLMAPGNCILSTATRDATKATDSVTDVYLDGSDYYAVSNGTSFSAPHVAGAAALYKATHKNASPAQVLSALRANRERGHVTGDPDGIDEGILNVAGF